MLRAVATQKAPVLLAASAVAASVTGTTNETTLATVTIPAGAMGVSGGLHIYTTWSYTNSANSKTMRIRLGGAAGTQFQNIAATTTGQLATFVRIKNRGAANSQVGSTSTGVGGFGTASGAPPTASVDTSASVDLVLSGQLALGTETVTLENYEVWLIPGG